MLVLNLKKKLIKIISEDLANIDQNLLDAEINSCRKLNFFQASVQCIGQHFHIAQNIAELI